MTTIDERLKKANNLISQIRLIKLNVLEGKLTNQIKEVRETEIHHRKLKAIFDIAGSVLFLSMNLAMLVAIFTIYYIEGYVLTPSTAFTLISIAGILRHPLTWLASTIRGLIKGYVALDRLQKYYDCEEMSSQTFDYVNDPKVIQ